MRARNVPSASTYESQAAKWKQGFKPTAPQQGGGSRQADLEAVLIAELCSAVGSSSFPPRDVMQKLLRHLPNMDHAYACELLDDKLEHRLWQVQGKALSVLDAVLKTNEALAYKQYYAQRPQLLHELSSSRKDIIKSRAEKVLNVVQQFAAEQPVNSPSMPVQPAGNQSQAQVIHQSYAQPVIDLMGYDEPGAIAEPPISAPPNSAVSGFGFMNSMPEKSPLQDSFSTTTSTASESSLSPVAAPPTYAVSGFGFLNSTSSSTLDSPSDMMKAGPPSSTVSGFSFISAAQPEAPAAPTPSAPSVLTSNDIMVPAPTSAMSAFNFLNSTISSEREPTPVPAPEPSTSAFSFLASSSSPAPATPTPVVASRPVDIFDTMPLPVPAVQLLTSVVQEKVKEESIVHDPIHDAFEALSMEIEEPAHPLDAFDSARSEPEPPQQCEAIAEPIVMPTEKLREVILEIELPPGPMGLVLDRTITDMVVIERFIPLPSGERGYLELHPAICPGCALISINSMSVEGKGLDEVGPILGSMAMSVKVLRFKKLMNNGRTANPSTLAMPYVPPPAEEDKSKAERDKHMTDLNQYSEELEAIEQKLEDIIRREQASLPVADRKNQLAQLHGNVEKIQTQGIDAVILGPNPPPNFEEVKRFRSSLVRKADALVKRIQRTAETPPVDPKANLSASMPLPSASSSSFQFLNGGNDAAANPPSTGFSFIQSSLPTPPPAPLAPQADTEPSSAFSFLSMSAPPPSTSNVAPLASAPSYPAAPSSPTGFSFLSGNAASSPAPAASSAFSFIS